MKNKRRIDKAFQNFLVESELYVEAQNILVDIEEYAKRIRKVYDDFYLRYEIANALMTYRSSSYGREPYSFSSWSILAYAATTDKKTGKKPFESWKWKSMLKSPDAIGKAIAKESERFADWFYENCTLPITLPTKDDLMNFFKGRLGEYFWKHFLEGNVLFIYDETAGRDQQCEFRNAEFHYLPDFGIDLVCQINIEGRGWHNAVIQVKNWAKSYGHTNFKITDDIAQKAACQGMSYHFIPQDECEGLKDVIVCWFGTDDDVSRYIKEDPAVCDRTMVIGKNVLDHELNHLVNTWDRVEQSFKELGNMKK